eukprot:9457126-Lingulodinium_polyedra.AAC.1
MVQVLLVGDPGDRLPPLVQGFAQMDGCLKWVQAATRTAVTHKGGRAIAISVSQVGRAARRRI